MGQYDGGMVSQLGLGASFISIFGSLYIYFVNEDQSLGIFVGLCDAVNMNLLSLIIR